MIDIKNHSVKISNLGLLQFMYPNFIIIDKPILITDNPVIYTGETKYINQIKNLGQEYIIVSQLAEYDLTDRKTLLDVAFTKYNKKIPKYILEFYEDLDDNTFMDLFKEFWITGKWNLKEYNKSGVFLEFLKSFKTDTLNISKTYLDLLNKVEAEYIEVSLFTFLHRVTISEGKLSKWYQQVINNYKQSKYELIEPAINKFIDSNISNNELKIFNLVLDLNRKTLV